MDHPGNSPLTASRQYAYISIDSTQQKIRLLNVKPGGYDEEAISISLSHVRLSDKPTYVALSYVWCDKKAARTCSLDDVRLAINDSLYRALRRFRGESKCLTLWVDALCINQNDLDERSAQVQLMRKTYEGADSISAWLGIPQNNDNVEAAVRIVNPLTQRVSAD